MIFVADDGVLHDLNEANEAFTVSQLDDKSTFHLLIQLDFNIHKS